jgi:trimethylamine--corrinoid protein Co-methyltransferase
VVQAIAEGLMSLILVQLRKPGAPCFLSANVGVFDMSTTKMCMAAPETSLGLAAQAEVAQSWGLPTWGLAGATDSKVLDAQAGLESAFSILAQGLAGLNLIHDVGYMDMGMICSADMLVLGDEVIGMTKSFIRGIEVNTETLARSVIEQVGPGGHYLQADHTYDHFREQLWRPRLLARQGYDEWQQAGATDMAQRIREQVIDIIESHEVPPLPDNTVATLAKLKQKGEEELSKL